jgi:hypothetical protein
LLKREGRDQMIPPSETRVSPINIPEKINNQ